MPTQHFTRHFPITVTHQKAPHEWHCFWVLAAGKDKTTLSTRHFYSNYERQAVLSSSCPLHLKIKNNSSKKTHPTPAEVIGGNGWWGNESHRGAEWWVTLWKDVKLVRDSSDKHESGLRSPEDDVVPQGRVEYTVQQPGTWADTDSAPKQATRLWDHPSSGQWLRPEIRKSLLFRLDILRCLCRSLKLC